MRGSIIKRGKTYTYVLYLGRDAAGKKRQKWVGGFRTKKEAENGLTEALERRRTGTWGEPGRQTMDEYLTTWLDATSASLRPKTVYTYRSLLRNWVLPHIGHIRLAAITPADLASLYAKLLTSGRNINEGGLSPTSVRLAHTVISHALKDAVRWGLLPRNPAQVVDPPRRNQPEMAVWSADEARTFLAHVAEDRHYAMWALFLATGMRRGEVLGLQWPDIDLADGTVSVRRTRGLVGRDVMVAEPKTPRSRRLISLDPITLAALKEWRRRQAEELLAIGARPGERWVWTDEVGEPVYPRHVSERFRELADASGLPRVTLHGLRHTSATLSLAAGIHPKIVSGRLGHSTIATTLDIYSHALREIESDAATKVAGLLYPPSAQQESSG